jgi:hypothetical protein
MKLAVEILVAWIVISVPLGMIVGGVLRRASRDYTTEADTGAEAAAMSSTPATRRNFALWPKIYANLRMGALLSSSQP